MAAAASRLVFGQQHSTSNVSTSGGAGEKIGVCGSGFGDDIESTPSKVRPDQTRAQGRDVDRVASIPMHAREPSGSTRPER